VELIHGPKVLTGHPKIEAGEETINFGTNVWNRQSGDLYWKSDDGFKKITYLSPSLKKPQYLVLRGSVA
jgi:hypothetical protein